ncbi:hypothetical protein RHGRI_035629 [Rhododendron griersonianum]|uniref:HMA domain-containing protein n=1 Tax=Rhododendron griersonianum TaxID=479676 RepID=A0AAV6HKL2_9ERIC|nr:hypothetical protein RHGRI_035629 [Rhododendron griersonianum]
MGLSFPAISGYFQRQEWKLQQQQWSRLPREILIAIAKCLNKTIAAACVDTLRLRSVCKSWCPSIPTFKQQQETIYFSLNLPFPISPNLNLNLNLNLRGSFSLSQNTMYFLQPTPSSSSLSKSSSFPRCLGLKKRMLKRANGCPPTPSSRSPPTVSPNCFPKSLNLLDFRISQVGVAYSIRFVHEDTHTMRSNKEEEEDWTIMRITTLIEQSKWTKSQPTSDLRVDATLAEEFKLSKLYLHCQAMVVAFVVVRLSLFLVKSSDDLFYLFDKYLGSKSVVHLEVYKLNETNKEWEMVNHLNDQICVLKVNIHCDGCKDEVGKILQKIDEPRNPIAEIDLADVDNKLAVVEYVEDMYKFYKQAEVKVAEEKEGMTVRRQGRPHKSRNILGKKLFNEQSSSEEEDAISVSDKDAQDEKQQEEDDEEAPLIHSIRSSSKLCSLRVSREENKGQRRAGDFGQATENVAASRTSGLNYDHATP